MPSFFSIDVVTISLSVANSLTLSMSIFVGRSVLFNKIMRLKSFVCSNKRRSSSINSSLWFKIKSTKSASFNALRLRSTPIRSTTSSVSRIPAVSISWSGTPRTFTYSSIVSRVVPAISVTMAFSSRNNTFNKLDFPTFGRPTIAVFNPSRKIFPWLAVFSKARIPCETCCVFSRNSCKVISSTSSYSG